MLNSEEFGPNDPMMDPNYFKNGPESDAEIKEAIKEYGSPDMMPRFKEERDYES